MTIPVLFALAVALLGSTATATYPATNHGRVAPAARCKLVRKRVRGKIRKVRVCRRTKPALPPAGTVVATIPLPATAGSLAVGDGVLWAGLGGAVGEPTAARIDLQSNSVGPLATSSSGEFAIADGSLWITDFDQDLVARLDEHTGTPVATIQFPPGSAPEGIVAAEGYVWVATHHGNPTGSVTAIDPATNSIAARIPVGATQDCCGPQGLAAGAAALWTSVPNLNSVVRIDTASRTVSATIAASPACGQIAADDNAVWNSAGCDTLQVTRIDPKTNAVAARISLPNVPAGTSGPAEANNITIAFGSVWITTDGGAYGELVRIDPSTNRVVGELRLPASGGSVVSAESDLWIATGRSLLRIQPA